MIRSNWLAALALTSSLVFSGHLLAKDPAPETDKTEKPAKAKADVAESELTDTWQKIADDAELKGKKLDEFKEKVAEGNKELAAMKESKEGVELVELRKELAAARKEKNEAKIKELDEKIAPLNTKMIEQREKVRAKILDSLTAKEQSKVVSGALTTRLTNALKSAELTEKQIAKIRELADAQADGYLKENPLSSDPMMKHLLGLQSSMVKDIRADVLTEEQRKAYDEAKKKTATTKPKKEE